MASDKHAKLLALQAAINGNTQTLKELKAKQGRLFTPEEREAQRLYLSELSGYEADAKETARFFGRYEPNSGDYYRLPNGMALYF